MAGKCSIYAEEEKGMGQEYFEWSAFQKENAEITFPADTLEEIFLLDVQEESIWLSRRTAELLFDKKEEMVQRISMEQFTEHLSESSGIALKQEIQRLLFGKARRVSCHAAIRASSGYLSTVIYVFRLDHTEQLLGFVSVDYEPSREYDRHLEQVIQQLQHVQDVNQLILEGASDYIYQLDVVNNICTFSSKALDVLPLETPTFSDAMNRVLSFIIPEDRQIFLDSFIPFLTGQSDRHTAQYRVLTKQGNIMWISCQGKGLHDEDGRPLMIAGSLLDITEQKKHEEEIQQMLYYDMLTGLKNRRCFEQEMNERLTEENARGSFLYMDIRKFKLYNELFGHNFGNRVLEEFSYMLKLYFPNALGIYRFSGDEFMVHLRAYTRGEILAKLAPFLNNLKKMREIDGHTLYVSACIAVVVYPEHGRTVEELMKNANQCLYRMSREDKEEVSFFAAERGDEVSWRFLVENEIRKDIEHNFQHFRVVYQPIVHVDEKGAYWIGAEALLRYNNPDFPQLEQMKMIRTLEYSGMILPIGRWVISQAVHECSRWNSSGVPAIVHVNIAAQQVADGGLINHIQECCAANGLPAKNLVVELTETSLLNNFDIATHLCESLRKLGIGVALDDFGTGYSNFNYLRQLPLSEIKVDREYVKQISDSRYNQIIVSFLHNLSEDLKLKLCVEGVETEPELKQLLGMGVSMIQGFYFERPLEADVIRREFPEKAKIRK